MSDGELQNNIIELKNQRKLEIDLTVIKQLSIPIFNQSFFSNYDQLVCEASTNEQIAKEIAYLHEMIDRLSQVNQIEVLNKEKIILSLYNASRLEPYDPRSGYILYDRNTFFIDNVFKNFPNFSSQLCEDLKNYLIVAGLPDDKDLLNYLFYITYSIWDHLSLNLHKKRPKIKLLIISNRHIAHSDMIKDIIDYEFSENFESSIFEGETLNVSYIEKSDYDLIVANFSIPNLESKRVVCIENIPSLQDIRKIQTEINEIIFESDSYN